MHYDSKAFGVNGAVTITRIDGSENLGNNNGLSRLDVRQAKKLYKCGGEKLFSAARSTDARVVMFAATAP